jgi:O-antigen ligase
MALLIGAFVHGSVYFPSQGIFINLALFDLVVPILIIVGLVRRHLILQINRLSKFALVAVAIIVIHSIVMVLFVEGLNEVLLIKESAKLVVVIIQFSLLIFLFQAADLRQPHTIITALCLAVALPVTFLISHYEISITPNPNFIPRTILAVVLTGLLFMLALDGKWASTVKRRAYLIASAAAVTVVTALVFSKSATGMAAMMTLWLLFGVEEKSNWQTPLTQFTSALAVIVLIAVFILPFMTENIYLLSRMDGWERSIGVRLDLWKLAIEQMWLTFPIGLGAGQFAEIVRANNVLVGEGHQFVHNSLLSLVVEFGLVGFLLLLAVIPILYKATISFPPVVIPLFLILVIPPILIHDGHTIRMIILAIAFGYARHIYDRSRGTDQNGETADASFRTDV